MGDGGANPILIVAVVGGLIALVWWLVARSSRQGGSGWRPTHRIPHPDLPVWDRPDPADAPRERLTGGTEVRKAAQRGAWMRVTRPDRWSGWVDGRKLEPIPPEEPAAPPLEPEPLPDESPAPEAQAPATPAPIQPAGPAVTFVDDAMPVAQSAVLAVPAPFVEQFRARIEDFSASLTGLVLRPGERLLFAGIPLAVASVSPAEGTVSVDTIVRVRRSAQPVAVSCAACGSETRLPADSCDGCGAPVAATVVAERIPTSVGFPARAAVGRTGEAGLATAAAGEAGWRVFVPVAVAVVLFVGAIVPWLFYRSSATNGTEIGLWAVLFNGEDDTPPNLLVALVIVALAAALACIARIGWTRRGVEVSPGRHKAVGWVIVLAGLTAMIIGGAYLLRLWGEVDGFDDFIDVVGWGPFLELLGGFVLVRGEGRSGSLRSLARLGRGGLAVGAVSRMTGGRDRV